MISTVTTTTTTFNPLFLEWALIVLLASIVFHYIKTKEYKGIIVGSILIGIIFGLIFGIIDAYLSTLIPLLSAPFVLFIIGSLFITIFFGIIGFIIALFGGLIAVTLKRILKK